jgi:hypothetical protein
MLLPTSLVFVSFEVEMLLGPVTSVTFRSSIIMYIIHFLVLLQVLPTSLSSTGFLLFPLSNKERKAHDGRSY